MKTHISSGNQKLGNIPNFSLTPAKACPKGVPCAKAGQCYALKSLIYPAVKSNWGENLTLAKRMDRHLASDLSQWLAKNQPKFFRIHVGGDFISQEYLNMWITLAIVHPGTKFLAFTKNHGLDFSHLPSNFTVVFSMWTNWGDTKQDMPRAWMRDASNPDSRIPYNALECPGNCESCGLCWNLPSIKRDVVFDKH